MKKTASISYMEVAPHAGDRNIYVHHVDSIDDCNVIDNGMEVDIYVTDSWLESVFKQDIATAGGRFTLCASQVHENADYQIFRASWIAEGICSHVERGYIAVGDSPMTDPKSCEGTVGHGRTMAEAMARVVIKRAQMALTDLLAQ